MTTGTPSPAPDVRDAWAVVASVSAGTDTLVGELRGLTAAAVGAFEEIDAVDVSGMVRSVPVTERIASARELSFAAARLHHTADVMSVLAAGAVESEGVPLDDHFRSTAKWMEHHHGISWAQAAIYVRCALACGRYDKIAAAFQAGEISLGHVNAVAGIIPGRFHGELLDAAVEAVAGIQDRLIEAARKHESVVFGEFCDRVRDRLDPDGRPDRAAEPSRVWLSKTVHGRWKLDGDLSADDGALLATILLDRMAKNRRADRDDDPTEDCPDADDPKPCASEQRARALCDLVADGAGAKAPGRVGVYVHIDLDHLKLGPKPSLAEALTDHTAPHTEAALDLSVDTLWSLLADADVTPIFTREGHTLSYGRTRRLAPAILRRIIAHRDRRCRIPGCDQPAVVTEAHHLIEWDADGGPTDPSNTCAGCGFHHHDIHDRGLRVTGDADGELTVTNPDGTPYDPTPGYRRRPRSDEPDEPGEPDDKSDQPDEGQCW